MPPLRTRRILITGVSRSGTGFMAHILSNAGWPCGHERVYTPYGRTRWVFKAESSWLAVPFLAAEKSSSFIIHLTRHPLECARSHIGIRFFDDVAIRYHQRFIEYVKRYNVEAFQSKVPIDRFLAHWIKWNEMTQKHANTHLRIEDASPEKIIELGEKSNIIFNQERLEKSFRMIPKNINSRDRDESVTMNDLLNSAKSQKLEQRFSDLIEKFGYSSS